MSFPIKNGDFPISFFCMFTRPGTIKIAFFNWGIWWSTFGEACWKDLGLGQNSSDLGKHRWECLFSALYVCIYIIIYIYDIYIRSKWLGYSILTHTQMSKIQGLWHFSTLWHLLFIEYQQPRSFQPIKRDWTIRGFHQDSGDLKGSDYHDLGLIQLVGGFNLPLLKKMKVSWDD